MRLTLRTMLAYLDDILEPDDSQDIGRKIEESEFATNLVHRVRDCMRRMRLGVPPLTGRGLGSDPNTVAEYLDNTLSADRVAEFEKICLESDVHLAEVASSHQILTLVLGEPAEIDAESRQRMYRLAAHADAPPANRTAVGQAVGQESAGSIMPVAAVLTSASAARPSRRAKPEVPDYLRESRSRWWPVAAMVLVGAMLSLGALWVFGPAEWRQQAADMVQAPGSSANAPAEVDHTDEATVGGNSASAVAATPGDDASPDQVAPATSTVAVPAGTSAQGDAPPDPANLAAVPSQSGTPTNGAVTAAPIVASSTPGDTSAEATLPPAGADPIGRPTNVRPGDLANTPPPPVPDATSLLPVAPQPDPTDVAISPTQPGNPTLPGIVAPGIPPADATAAPRDIPPGDTGPEVMGRFTPKRGEVMLRFDSATGDWKRLAASTQLVKGDRLLALPLYRPMLTLASDVTIQTDGAALVELVGMSDKGVPIVSIERGRVWLATVGKAGNSVLLKLAEHQPLLTFVDADSVAALDVRRELPPGRDPADGAPLVAELVSSSGAIRITEGNVPLELQSPARRTLWTAATRQSGDKMPEWATLKPPRNSDQQAMSQVEQKLSSDRLTARTLKEILSERQQGGMARKLEVRSLLIRSLCQLDSFETAIESLNDTGEDRIWPLAFEELRAGVSRNSDTAAKIRATLEAKRGADAAKLYRMLWSYSADDLKAGADRELVAGLNDNSLDMRVLSFYTLEAITGLPNKSYKPADSATTRRTKVQAWERDYLNQGKIVPRPAAN